VLHILIKLIGKNATKSKRLRLTATGDYMFGHERAYRFDALLSATKKKPKEKAFGILGIGA
jgi:hypothetical protein